MVNRKKNSIERQEKWNPLVNRRSRATKVWHITDWQDLYELNDDVRKKRSGPLRYVKTLATLSPFCLDAEARYFERLCQLKASPKRHLLRSALEELKTWCATKPFGVRGYLVTAQGKPATYKYLAEQLTMKVSDIEYVVPALGRLGYLERISIDGQAVISLQKTDSAKKPKNVLKKTKQKSRRKAQNGAKHAVECPTNGLPDSAGLGRNGPESSCRPSRKAKTKPKSKSKKVYEK